MRLVAELESKGIGDPAVARAMSEVPRHLFVPDHLTGQAYDDRALPIGSGQTISQPYIVAYMSDLLDLDEGERVLEIGTGSGYQAAVLAELGAEVYSVEILPELTRRAGANLGAAGYKDVRLRTGDGYVGWPGEAPFDAIIVTASAPRLPARLLEQLATGGRMVLPMDGAAFSPQWIWLVTKGADGVIEQRRMLPVRFVDMTGEIRDKAKAK